ncbi:MAG: YbaN family protein [Actinomycetota bacterium]
MSGGASVARSPLARAGWTLLGLLAVVVGGIGVVVPGLPTTVFFIVAAWAFSKSSPRLEAWVLGLPKIGPMVQDYRDGKGMPRRVKIVAISMVVAFCSLSIWAVDQWWMRLLIAALALIGIAVILRQPTKQDEPAS